MTLTAKGVLTMDKLKPCPFCGGEAQWVGHGPDVVLSGLVAQHTDDCFFRQYLSADPQWQTAWNTRAGESHD